VFFSRFAPAQCRFNIRIFSVFDPVIYPFDECFQLGFLSGQDLLNRQMQIRQVQVLDKHIFLFP